MRRNRVTPFGELIADPWLVCLALADGLAPTGSRVADEHRIARSTLREALRRLLADERQVTRHSDGRPYLLDPLLREWLRRR